MPSVSSKNYGGAILASLRSAGSRSRQRDEVATDAAAGVFMMWNYFLEEYADAGNCA
jgi:hypothetical protein